jgi:hypothetical protein
MPNPQPDIPTTENPEPPKTRQRHGCLITYLIFIIIAAVIAVVTYSACSIRPGFMATTIDQIRSAAGLPNWAYPVFALIGCLELVCSIALYRWKKWGFWGFCGIAVLIFVVYVALYKVSSAFTGLIGVLILFGVLHIGDKNNQGWPQLE